MEISRAYKYSGLFIQNKDLNNNIITEIDKIFTCVKRDFMTGDKRCVEYYYKLNSGIFIPRNSYKFVTGDLKFNKIINCLNEGRDISFKMNNFEFRKEQKKYIDEALAEKEAILCLPCGYGKTFMAIYIIYALQKRALILVIKDTLRTTFKKRILQFTELTEDDISFDPLNTKAPIVVTTIQHLTYFMRTQPEMMISLFHKKMEYGIVILDECHVTTGPEKFTHPMILFKSRYLLGFSATPYRSTKQDMFSFKCWFGPKVIGEEVGYDLVPVIKTIKFRSGIGIKGTPYEKSLYYIMWKNRFMRNRYAQILQKHEAFLVIVIRLILWCYKRKRKVLIMSEGKKLLRVIELKLYNEGIPQEHIGLYFNPDKIKEVKRPRKGKFYNRVVKKKDIEKETEKQLILATVQKCGIGNDVVEIDTIIPVSPIGNRGTIEQICGRGLRPHDEKSHPLFFDIVDEDVSKCVEYRHSRIIVFKAKKFIIE